jgi:O-antigen ligase
MAELSPLGAQIKKAPVFGSGFGTTLTFKSEDPRVTTVNPTGMYTTSAFEWGYLDITMKIGIVGLGIYLYLIWKIGTGLWKKRADNYNLGLLLGLIALLVINIFSPYLNHPLGIGYLMILTALI